MKILWVGDSPTIETGFGVVTKNLTTRLARMGHEIDILGINFFGNPYDHKEFPFNIWPTDKGSVENVYGYNKLWWLADKIKPDVIFFLNDPWIINSYMERKPQGFNPLCKFVAYYPTDAAPIMPEWAKVLGGFDAQICYSKYAERVVIESNEGKRPKNLHQIYHGVDREVFKPLNQSQARTALGIPLDSFIVGMVARNQPRKRFDVLMRAFAEFAKDKPKAKLYLHTALNDVGWNIPDISRQLGLKDKLIMTSELKTPTDNIPARALNVIYNTFDVNTLISLGDGFGLPVAESMSTGCAQLVSDHSCLKELVENHGGLTVKTAAWIMNTSGINTWGGLSDEKDLVVKLNQLYESEPLRVALSEQGYKFISQDCFTWDYAANEFDRVIKDIFHVL